MLSCPLKFIITVSRSSTDYFLNAGFYLFNVGPHSTEASECNCDQVVGSNKPPNNNAEKYFEGWQRKGMPEANHLFKNITAIKNKSTVTL